MTNFDWPVTPDCSSEHTVEQRFHYLDNLRAMAMMLGVFYHATMAYSPMFADVWSIADARKSQLMDFFAFFTHLFRMPLFMFIAGFFAQLLLKKRGLAAFIKNRSLRIVMPLVIFLPVLFAAFIAVVYYAAITVENKSPMLIYVIENYTQGTAPNQPFSTMHLWFLLNLVWFYIGAVVVITLCKRISDLSVPLFSISVKRVILLFALPLVLVPALYSQHTDLIGQPDRVYPQAWSFGYYGVFFAFGWLFFNKRHMLDSVQDFWKPMVAISLVFYLIAFSLYPEKASLANLLDPAHYTIDPIKHLVVVTLEAFIGVYMVMSLLILGRQYLDFKNPLLRYFSSSSYWVYIIHAPILMFIQTKLMDRDWNIWIEFLLSSLLTFVICLLSYQVLVRNTPIGWMLNGKIKKALKNEVPAAVQLQE